MKKYIDARNLPNPQPLVYTKRALAEGEFSYLIIHVNNATAKDNVIRFAAHAGFPVEKTEEREGEYFITIANTEELPSTVEPKGTAPPATATQAEGSGSQEEAQQAQQAQQEDSPQAAESFDFLTTPGHPHQIEYVKTLLLGAGGSGVTAREGSAELSPFLRRVLSSLPHIHGGLQQLILTGAAAHLAEEQSEYLPLLLQLRRRGIKIYCDQESCEEWRAAPSAEAVTLIDARSLTEKLLSHAAVLSL
jgi:TusA-related sulfurtransferase